MYDSANRRTSLTLPNGVVTDYTYDAASRLTGLTYKNGPNVLGTLTYAYDNGGNRAQVGGTRARTGLPQAMATATYNAANHQLTFSGQNLTYDLNGSLTRDGTTTYTWDARNRLASLSGPGATASFQYDPLGRRTRKTVNGITTDFLYDGVNPVQELSGAVAVANILTGLGIDEYLTRTDSVGIRALLTDALGSTPALTDPTGTVQTQYTYDPFGATTTSGPTSGNPFQYTGRENDGTGLYYYRARYHSPVLHRFLAEDPIRLASAQVNFYVYVGDAPTNFVDPLGLTRLTYGEMVTLVVANNRSPFSNQLILCVAWNESSHNPNVRHPGDVARGLMGVTPIGARDVGADYNAMRDPSLNIQTGSALLTKMVQNYSRGDLAAGLQRYGGGPRYPVQRVVDCEKCLNGIPEEVNKCPSEGPRQAQQCFDIIHK